METERWLPVVGYEGLYEVSDLGRVRSLRGGCKQGGTQLRPAPIILAQHWKSDGYLHITLIKNKKRTTPRIHPIVLKAFREPRPRKHEGAHWDGDKANNRLSNLRWATSLENKADMLRHGATLRGEHHPRSLLTEAEVRAIKASPKSSRIVGAQFGISSSAVRQIRQGKVWAHV